ncbi:MAG: hypothetical protein J6B28_05080 [Eubacterium sp.]|nr:hypothetical protein [Eubacterium sp.]
MDNEFSPTPFDSHLQNRTLQLLKTAIPYIPYPRQRLLATAVKIMELSRANSLFEQKEPALQMCEGMNTSNRILQMLDAIRPLCVEADQANIDMITNVLSMADIYNGMFSGQEDL